MVGLDGEQLTDRPHHVAVVVLGGAARVAAVDLGEMRAAVLLLHDATVARVGSISGDHHDGTDLDVHAAFDNVSDNGNQQSMRAP